MRSMKSIRSPQKGSAAVAATNEAKARTEKIDPAIPPFVRPWDMA